MSSHSIEPIVFSGDGDTLGASAVTSFRGSGIASRLNTTWLRRSSTSNEQPRRYAAAVAMHSHTPPAGARRQVAFALPISLLTIPPAGLKRKRTHNGQQRKVRGGGSPYFCICFELRFHP